MSEGNLPSQKEPSRQTARWDAQNIFKNYFVLVTTQIGGAFLSFATVWIATRLYTTEGYGNIVAIVAGSQAVQLFTNWTNVALARYGVEEFVETGSIKKAFWSRTAIAVPNLILVASTMPLWIYWLSALLHLPRVAIPFIILHFISAVIWLHFQQALQAAKMPRLQGILIFLERAVVLILVIILGYFFKLSWLYAFFAFIIASLLMSIIAWWKTRDLTSGLFFIDRLWIKKLMAFSIPLVPYSITSFFCTNYLDAFFITKYLSKSELGIYSVAYQINGLLLQFLILIGTLLMPMFVTLRSKKNHNYIEQYLEDLLPLVTLAWGVFITFFAIVAGYIIPLIFGPGFSNINSIVWVFMVGSTFTLPSLIGYSPFATAAAAVYISFPMTLATASANVIGDLILIPKWGLIGSAWATFISSVIGMVSMVLLIKWKFNFKTKFLFLSITPSLLALALFLFKKNMLQSSVLSLGMTVILFVIYRKKAIKTISETFNFKRILISKSF